MNPERRALLEDLVWLDLVRGDERFVVAQVPPARPGALLAVKAGELAVRA